MIRGRKMMETMYRVVSQTEGRTTVPKKANFQSLARVGPGTSSFSDEINDQIGRRAFVASPIQYPPLDRTNLRGEFGTYAEEYEFSVENPQSFWGEEVKNIHWFEPPTKVLSKDPDKPYSYQWFADGTTNTAYNCLDVHVNQGHGQRTALIYDSPLTGVKTKFSYQELLDKVSTFAGALKDRLGVNVGDRVIIYMPMIPEAIIAMVSPFRFCGATLS
jgi:hypothetical protein